MKEEITKLLIEHGERPEAAKSEALESAAELLAGSPLETRLDEILGKVTNLEESFTKITALEESIEKITKLFEKGGFLSGNE